MSKPIQDASPCEYILYFPTVTKWCQTWPQPQCGRLGPIETNLFYLPTCRSSESLFKPRWLSRPILSTISITYALPPWRDRILVHHRLARLFFQVSVTDLQYYLNSWVGREELSVIVLPGIFVVVVLSAS